MMVHGSSAGACPCLFFPLALKYHLWKHHGFELRVVVIVVLKIVFLYVALAVL